MPYYKKSYRKKKKTSSKGKRKRFQKSFNHNNQNALFSYKGNPFPSCSLVKGNWVQSNGIVTQASVGLSQFQSLMNLGSAWDPNVSAGLGQEAVQFHNIYATYYQKYTVNYVSIEIMIRNAVTSQDDCRVTCMCLDDQNQIAAMAGNVSADEISMQKYTQTRVLEADPGSRYNRCKLNFKFNVNKWRKRLKVDPENASALINANPTTFPIFAIMVQSDGAANQARIRYDLKTTYWTKYHTVDSSAIAKAQ